MCDIDIILIILVAGLAVSVHTWLLKKQHTIVNRLFPFIAFLLATSVLIYLVYGNWKFFMLLSVYVIIACIIIVFFRNTNVVDKIQFHFLIFLFIISLAIVLIFGGLKKGQVYTKARSIDKISAYFESIRDNEAALTAFFQDMPKGADLHNHYTGSVYAEKMLDRAIGNKYFINTQTLVLDTAPRPGFERIDTLVSKSSFGVLRQRIYQNWSIKDYWPGIQGTDQHFFDAFGKFPFETPADTRMAMQELLERAAAEHVTYLELMTGGPKYRILDSVYRLRYAGDDNELRRLMQSNATDSIDSIFEKLFAEFTKVGNDSVRIYLKSAHDLYNDLQTQKCEVRYLVQGKRESRPVDLFRGLVMGFMAAEKDSIVIGVNIVQREDGPISMKDYRLHMEMFRFLHEKMPKVRYSMHAGELTLGSVPPEDLTFHIHEAVFVAGAQRIGHGVDLPYETNRKGLLDRMREKKIAVEINLWSNDYILKVREGKHPIMQYFNAGVPIVISTDDAGILRSGMTHQYVLLAMRYKEIGYNDIKKIIRNSIEYSFINDKKLKDRLMEKLNDDMKEFERNVLK